jgi:hypothetical protein
MGWRRIGQATIFGLSARGSIFFGHLFSLHSRAHRARARADGAPRLGIFGHGSRGSARLVASPWARQNGAESHDASVGRWPATLFWTLPMKVIFVLPALLALVVAP